MTQPEARAILSELSRAWSGEQLATIGDRVIYKANIGAPVDGQTFLYSVKEEERPGDICPVCYNQPYYTEPTTERSYYLPSVIALFGWRDMAHFREVTRGHSGKSWATADTILRAFNYWQKGEFRYKKRKPRHAPKE